jgi:hypothetical protein
MDGTVLTCRLHQSRLALLPVAVLHHLEEKGVRVGAYCGGRVQRTSMMHDIPRYLLHQVLERDLCELRWKDILDQVRITFSDLVARAQYWYLHPRATISSRHGVVVSCGTVTRCRGVGNDPRLHVVTSGHFGYDGESGRREQWSRRGKHGHVRVNVQVKVAKVVALTRRVQMTTVFVCSFSYPQLGMNIAQLFVSLLDELLYSHLFV